jgi:hypothetical protein
MQHGRQRRFGRYESHVKRHVTDALIEHIPNLPSERLDYGESFRLCRNSKEIGLLRLPIFAAMAVISSMLMLDFVSILTLEVSQRMSHRPLPTGDEGTWNTLPGGQNVLQLDF